MSETEPEEENMLAANAILCAQLPNVSSAEKKREEVLINEIVPEENSELFCAISSNFISDWQFLDGSLRIRFVKTSSEFLLKKPQIKSIIAAIMKRIQEKERLLNDEQRKLRNYRVFPLIFSSFKLRKAKIIEKSHKIIKNCIFLLSKNGPRY